MAEPSELNETDVTLCQVYEIVAIINGISSNLAVFINTAKLEEIPLIIGMLME